MEKWITLKTFSHPTEGVILRAHLESEGIECILLNEYTAQINIFYSQAIGGVQLQVHESDYEKAASVMKESGYVLDENETPMKWLLVFDQYSRAIPLLNKCAPIVRFILILGIISAVLVGAIALSL